MKLDELETKEIKPFLEVSETRSENFVGDIIKSNADKTNDVKTAIDLATTQSAISQEETVEKLVREKKDELINDAEKKRVIAETEKIAKEVDKVRAEADKQIAELEKSINNKRKELEELTAQTHKEEAFFDSHKSILRYIGVKNKLSIKAMKGWLVPASIIYFIVQVLLFPLTLIGVTVECITDIVGGICGKISKQGWKIAVAVVMIFVIIGLCVGAYFLVSKGFINIFK